MISRCLKVENIYVDVSRHMATKATYMSLVLKKAPVSFLVGFSLEIAKINSFHQSFRKSKSLYFPNKKENKRP